MAETSARKKSTKILVAVHGIGDQIGYEAAQLVARQVGAYYNIAAPIPLGRFYTATGDDCGTPMPMLMAGDDPPPFHDIGFAEVYWASIPRKIVADGHILEESKKWAMTVAARLALRAQSQGNPVPQREQLRLNTVLDEMIETVAVIERLNWLLAKAGLFKFNLNKLLTDFLGDVQIVVDFQSYRQQILDSFSRVMDEALKLGEGPDRELYLVGHSEGSVITFLALLTALANPDEHPWIKSVRGVMTIGSPIEVHHLLWPSLWQGLTPAVQKTPLKIPWHNYYDYGDPIAYELTSTRAWLKAQKFAEVLQLTEIPFARSYLPGKAHVDYWTDNAIFTHFMDQVVCPPKPTPPPAAPVPGSKWTAVAVSYAVPKLMILALICAATYALYRPVAGAILYQPAETAATFQQIEGTTLFREVNAATATDLPSTTVLRDVLGIGLLLLGVTVAARIPRLTNKWRWWLVAAAYLVVSMAAYEWLAIDNSRGAIGILFIELAHRELPMWSAADIHNATRGVQLVAGLVALLAGSLASWYPSWGTRILPLAGLGAVAVLMGELIWSSHQDMELWPVALGCVVFFYLWRVTALLFDLVFIWHRYIRHAAALHSIAEVCDKGYVKSQFEKKFL